MTERNDMFAPALKPVLREIGETAAGFDAMAWAVGGIARQSLTGETVKDIDVALEGNPNPVANALARRWNAELRAHDRFGTVNLLCQDGLSVDIARTRDETYAVPGALPTVIPADIEKDLARRDFSVNAIAVCLTPNRFGFLLDPFHGREDLSARALRVLHPDSFRDDPTRLFRAARYAVRYRLEPAPDTEAAAALGDVWSVSADRRRAEVERICAETEWFAMTAWLNRWGVWSTLSGGWEPSERFLRRMDTCGAWARPALGRQYPDTGLRLLALLAAAPPKLLESLAIRPAEQNTWERARHAADSLSGPEDGAWYREMDRLSVDSMLVALTLVSNDPQKERLTRYLTHIRHLRPAITGDDLVSAGASPGPELGLALQKTLDALRTGLISGPESQLAYALAAWRNAVEQKETECY